jgi:sugar phosphate isomerase/epimerase
MRPVTMFTGQWANLPLDTLLAKVKAFGYDGVELACWSDHFDVRACLADDGWAKRHWALLRKHGLFAGRFRIT